MSRRNVWSASIPDHWVDDYGIEINYYIEEGLSYYSWYCGPVPYKVLPWVERVRYVVRLLNSGTYSGMDDVQLCEELLSDWPTKIVGQ